MYNNELYHHGIKGMKWGRRRYQNEDGSLTDAGVKRYARKGYAQDSYNSNKTLAGKAWDKYTGAHKMVGDAIYDTSSKAKNKARAEKYLADKAATPSAQKKAAKTAYKNATDKAFSQYEKTINDIEKNYKRGQNLSDKDLERERKAEETYQKAVAKAKSDYKTATSKKNNKSVANKKKATKNNDITNIIERERKRQRTHLAGKHAVRAGSMVVNGILSRNNVTLNGKALRINPGAVALVNLAMDYKYMRDSFKDK